MQDLNWNEFNKFNWQAVKAESPVGWSLNEAVQISYRKISLHCTESES